MSGDWTAPRFLALDIDDTYNAETAAKQQEGPRYTTYTVPMGEYWDGASGEWKRASDATNQMLTKAMREQTEIVAANILNEGTGAWNSGTWGEVGTSYWIEEELKPSTSNEVPTQCRLFINEGGGYGREIIPLAGGQYLVKLKDRNGAKRGSFTAATMEVAQTIGRRKARVR